MAWGWGTRASVRLRSSSSALRGILTSGAGTAPLAEIVGYCEENVVMAAAIDAQLTIVLSEENGYRTSDIKLRELLPPDCRTWVASFNSLG